MSSTRPGPGAREHFEVLGCGTCHAGAERTDSAPGILHDVGTITPDSGARRGEPLTGLDTPTLRGIWSTAPYLHDGSAGTIRDVLTTRNPDGAHGAVTTLDEGQLDDLVRYLLQVE